VNGSREAWSFGTENCSGRLVLLFRSPLAEFTCVQRVVASFGELLPGHLPLILWRGENGAMPDTKSVALDRGIQLKGLGEHCALPRPTTDVCRRRSMSIARAAEARGRGHSLARECPPL
jgi:hypothetical protein